MKFPIWFQDKVRTPNLIARFGNPDIICADGISKLLATGFKTPSPYQSIKGSEVETKKAPEKI